MHKGTLITVFYSYCFFHFHCWPICTHSRFVCFCSIYHPALMTRNQNFVVCFWKLEIIKWKLVGNDFNLKIASALYASFHFINIQYSFYWSPVVLFCRVWFVLDSTLIIVRHNLCFLNVPPFGYYFLHSFWNYISNTHTLSVYCFNDAFCNIKWFHWDLKN